MSIFGIIKSDDKVFTGDKLRIDVSDSFLAPGLVFATVSHEISVDGGVTWYNVSTTKKVDWIFTTSGTKTITLRLSTTEPAQQTFTKQVTVLNLTAQALFSNDSDLYKLEPDIDSYLPKKWSGWNLIHLQAQEWIMDWLDESRIYKTGNQKYVVADVVDIRQVKQLSCYKTLEFIFEGNSNVVGDLFSIKRDKYKSLSADKLNRNSIGLDYNGDSVIDPEERRDLFTGSLIRK